MRVNRGREETGGPASRPPQEAWLPGGLLGRLFCRGGGGSGVMRRSRAAKSAEQLLDRAPVHSPESRSAAPDETDLPAETGERGEGPAQLKSKALNPARASAMLRVFKQVTDIDPYRSRQAAPPADAPVRNSGVRLNRAGEAASIRRCRPPLPHAPATPG